MVLKMLYCAIKNNLRILLVDELFRKNHQNVDIYLFYLFFYLSDHQITSAIFPVFF